MGEKVIHEVKFVETDDGFRIEIKGDKERMRKMFDHGAGFGPGMRFRHRHHEHFGPHRHGPGRAWGWGYGPWGWWWDDESEEEGEPATGPAADKPPAGV